MVYISVNKITQIPNNSFYGVFSKGSILSLSFNQIQTIEANSFDGCDNLETLNLEYNQLSVLPSAFISLKSLTQLYVRVNTLTTLDESLMRSLGMSLTGLFLNHNQLKEWPESLHHLQFLVSLDLSNNPISDIPSGSFRAFKDTLQTLNIGSTGITHVPEDIRELTSLAVLDISYNPINDSGFPPGIFDSVKDTLTSLSIDNLRITKMPEDIATLRQLLYLSVRYNQIHYIDEDVLSNLTQLQTLVLENCGLQRIPYVVNMLPNLGSLDLSNIPILSLEHSDLDGMHKLSSLGMSGTSLQYISPAAFLKTQNLHTINLEFNLLTEVPFAIHAIPVQDLHIYIQFNPIQCSCDMKWMVNWINNQTESHHDVVFPIVGDCDNYKISIEKYY
ncbi:hypothetical protein ACJMK2_016050 [Sinanodonta woodiana]|uniref:Uncharacterized protein n=1 Tax=Sinanodonta woodiana TaxID=1069815 RepID=A0ABD3USD5_SINWO